MLALWTGFTGWWSRNPVAQWVTYAFLVLLGWEFVKRQIKESAKQAERAAIARKQAEERVRVVERTAEIITEERNNADQALEARDSGGAPATYDELPDSHKSLARGRPGSRQ